MAKIIRKVWPSDIPLDEPIEWSIFDGRGNLLLRKGFVITMPEFRAKIISRGSYLGEIEPDDAASVDTQESTPDALNKELKNESPPAPPPREPVFAQTTELVTAVARIHKILLSPPTDLVNLNEMIRGRAKLLIGLIEIDQDAVLASLYLSPNTTDTRPFQHVLGAAIAAIIAKHLGTNEDSHLSLVCAALMRDIGLYHFDRTHGHIDNIPETARHSIKEHTAIAIHLLKKHGINDSAMLRFIDEHHERPDGKGYPAGKGDSNIDQLSSLLNLADSYASMILANQRRVGKIPAHSMRELFLERGTRYIEKHVTILVKVLGKFPPGCLVQLANGEVGVIKSSQTQSVHTIYDINGLPKSTPFIRDTSLKNYEITGCLTPEKCKTAMLVIRKIWLG